MNWYLEVLKKYTVFNGRASRREYWMFFLFSFIFTVIAMVLDRVLGLTIESIGYGPIYLFYGLGVLIPSIAVGIRRLHDTGRSGWYMLVSFIPCVGGIILLVFFATPGDVGENEYGPDPFSYSY